MSEENKTAPTLPANLETPSAVPATSKTPPGKSLNWILFGLLLASLLLNVGVVGFYYFEKNQEAPDSDWIKTLDLTPEDFPETFPSEAEIYPQNNENPYAVKTLTPDPFDYSGYYQNLLEQEGVIWYQRPMIIPDQKLYVYIPYEIRADEYPASTYYQIGTYNDEPIVYVQVPCDGMCSSYMIFVVHTDLPATLIEKNSSVDLESEWSVTKLVGQVTVDKEFEFLALSAPEELANLPNTPKLTEANWSWGALEIFSESSFNPQFALNNYGSEGNIDFIADTEYGPLYRAYSDDPGAVTVDYDYGLRLPGGLLVQYDEAPLGFMSDDRVPAITWTNGGVNTDPYRGDRLTGCGGGGPESLITTLSSPSIELVGRTSNGLSVYNLVDSTHPLITRVFEMTQGIVYEYDQETGESTNREITTEEFIANRGVLIIESMGRQLVFTNTKYGPQAECAKPVIYLYPEATTTISVSVDAIVTKSEPVYENGWVATASPSGSLNVDGETYTSLFWDGYGNGEYPEITEGFIVPTEDALSTMAEHLQFMGFTDFEISEFVTFWADHLPEESYTRITWFETVEMERLAKLNISPRPRTLIRAFVDYEGVSEPFTLPEQKLTPNVRKGYVVTEWGGLLRKN